MALKVAAEMNHILCNVKYSILVLVLISQNILPNFISWGFGVNGTLTLPPPTSYTPRAMSYIPLNQISYLQSSRRALPFFPITEIN